ncbi:hypothetical protein HY095_03750 [Candidatus Micrarchaeota archaeon]|nr:hypothetical protein [Candidatus Micrarchaeota archaeon]
MKSGMGALVFLLLVSSAVWVSAHSDEKSSSCGAPAVWEFHKELPEVAAEGLAFVAGVAILALGWMRKGKPLIAFGALAAGVALVFFLFIGYPLRPELIGFGNAESIHEHADFAVFIDGRQLNFSQEKYMTLETGVPKSGLVDLHDGVGTVMHKHATGVTFAYFLKTIGWKLNESCIVSDRNESFCTSHPDPNDAHLELYVNGRKLQNFMMGSYSPQDGDRILLTLGAYQSEGEIKRQEGSITNYSCIYSEKCPVPAGFDLPAESCNS